MLKTRAGEVVGSGASGLFPGQTEHDVLLIREEVAAYLRCSLPTLELWQRNGVGPKFVRVGRGIRYRLSDLRAFVEAGAAATARHDQPKMHTPGGDPGAADRLGTIRHHRK